MWPRRCSRSRTSRTRCSRATSRTGRPEVLLKRRTFLYGGAAAAGLGAATAWRYWPEQGLWNPCRATLPQHLAEHPLVKQAWAGIDPAKVWDCHTHLIGTGDSGSGVVVHPGMESLLNPGQYARRLFFLNAGCVHDAPGSVDRSYVERVRNLMQGMPAGVKLLLYAFERTHGEDGQPDAGRAGIYVPDAYARDIARAYPGQFEWVASVHPYAKDFLERLETAKHEGARAVKWLPSAMGIDPSSPRCDRFYGALRKLNLPLISHAGLERAVLGSDEQSFGNPLHLRRALDAGVRVVIAHCASMGQDRDLDKGANGAPTDSFLLFSRLMDSDKYQPNLFGDISAVTQANRAGTALARLIERTEWHARLLNGSDYPLPGVMPIFSVDFLVSLGLVEASAAPVLKEIRTYNPLLFDFVLKRSLRSGSRSFPARVFETRGFFAGAQ